MRRKRRLLLFAMLAAASGWPYAGRVAAAEAFFDQTLGDLAEELRSALAAGKKGMLLVFEAEGCPYCRKMRESVFVREDVLRLYKKHFLIFSIDVFGAVPLVDFAGQETTEKALARAYRVRGTPTFVFIGAGGKELARHVGAADAETFLALGRRVARDP